MTAALFLALVPVQAVNGRTEEILVSAAASLTDVLSDIGKIFGSTTGNQTSFNFAGSSELARQIEEGAPADVFFSADLDKMDRLEQKGLIETGARKNVLSNQLAVIVPADSKVKIENPRDLLRPEVRRIALAEPSIVPVGIYTKKYMSAEGLWGGISGKIVPVLNARATLASVEAGNVEAGFVYKTDAAMSKKVRVAHYVPLDRGPKIIYPVAVIKRSKKKETAKDFLKFLSGPNAKSFFVKYGFVVLQ
ncbi:MAG: molybdate ABC transporter substrate-binding protein [Deltaproteobacteria bacterium]|nr:molybdate ABC transporter substrate-binding protein [Deltaproteobacteria bacterium]